MSLFGLGGQSPPALPPATVLPTPDDPTIKAAVDRDKKAAMLRKGRQSTILTTQQTLGVAPVAKKTLLGA